MRQLTRSGLTWLTLVLLSLPIAAQALLLSDSFEDDQPVAGMLSLSGRVAGPMISQATT